MAVSTAAARRHFCSVQHSHTNFRLYKSGSRRPDAPLLVTRARSGGVSPHPTALRMNSAGQNRRGFVSSSLNADGKPEVTLEQVGPTGGVAVLTLNKPERLNALTQSMIDSMSESVTGIFGDVLPDESVENGPGNPGEQGGDTLEGGWGEETRLLVLKGLGGKAFCAGGDIKAIAEGKVLGPGVSGTLRSDFFRTEYLLDFYLAAIAKEKALLALWDGVVMGGGVGISVHGTYRVATETTLFAMPETVIGLFPDVGTAYVLSRLPGGLGQYLGLTGTRLRGDDLLHCGLATHLVPKDSLAEVEAALVDDDGRSPRTVLERFVSDVARPDLSMLAKSKKWIDADFCGASSVEEIVQRLEARVIHGDSGERSTDLPVRSFTEDDRSAREWARETLGSLSKASPTALKVTYRHISWASNATLKECFVRDYRIMQHMVNHGDFDEGVRALLIDKDKKPRWSPSRLGSVSDAAVDALFADLGENELVIG